MIHPFFVFQNGTVRAKTVHELERGKNSANMKDSINPVYLTCS